MRKVLLQLLFSSSLILFVTSCEKGEEPFPGTTESSEKALIHFPEAAAGPLTTIALDLNPGIQTLNMIEIRREATSPAELQKTQIVKIKNQNAVIADPSSGEVTELPSHLYTSHPDNPFDGQYWTVTFGPGEFVKYLKINLDASTLLSAGGRVGLGFLIAEAPGAEISDDRNKLGVELSAKNQYDGRYKCTWTNYHPTANPGYTGSVTEIQLHTSGPDKVKLFWPLANAYCSPSILNGGLSYFLAQEPQYTVDINTNLVTVQNVAPGGTIVYSVAQGFTSRYEPATKKFFLKWGYNYGPGGAFDPANTREWTQTLEYLGPR